MTYDYGAHAAPLEEDSNILVQIRETARDQLRAEAEVARLEVALSEAKAELTRINERVFPDIMEAAEQQVCTTSDGLTVQLKEEVRAHLKFEFKDKAHDWLDANGHGAIVKRQFVIEFNKGEEAWARKFQRDLNQRKKPVRATIQRTVHSGTLKKFVREMTEEGEEVPLDILGVYRQRVTKIKAPK